ncbi:MAG: ABC transporter substrate-binding protein [Cyanobacteria bacterium P01_C01_bin.89]
MRWFYRSLPIRCGALALVAGLSITACGGDRPQSNRPSAAEGAPEAIASGCRTVSHFSGETEVCESPEKIVVLDAHSLDLLLSLGRQPAGIVTPLPITTDRVEQPSVAVPYLGNFVTTKPVYLGTAGRAPSLEVLTLLRPDLILGESWSVRSASEVLLPKVAPTVPLGPRTEKNQWRRNLRAMAQALGDENLANQAIARYEQQLAKAKKDLAEVVAQRPKVLLLTGESLTKGAIFILTGEGFIGQMLQAIGFEVVTPPGVTQNFIPSSVEVLPSLNEADMVFVLGYSAEASEAVEAEDIIDEKALVERQNFLIGQQLARIKADWGENAIAQSLTASKTDQVYFRTFYEWNVFNGPLGAELILTQLRESLLEE